MNSARGADSVWLIDSLDGRWGPGAEHANQSTSKSNMPPKKRRRNQVTGL
jgi:hypothetical protein